MGRQRRKKCRIKTRRGNSYADRDEAAVVAARVNAKRKPGRAARNPVVPYLCQLCQRWHVGKGLLPERWKANNEGEGSDAA